MKLRCHGLYGFICVATGFIVGNLSFPHANLVALFLYGGGGALMVEHLVKYKRSHD